MRYSGQNLGWMAKAVLEVKDRGDARANLLALQLSLRTGLTIDQVWDRIRGLA